MSLFLNVSKWASCKRLSLFNRSGSSMIYQHLSTSHNCCSVRNCGKNDNDKSHQSQKYRSCRELADFTNGSSFKRNYDMCNGRKNQILRNSESSLGILVQTSRQSPVASKWSPILYKWSRTVPYRTLTVPAACVGNWTSLRYYCTDVSEYSDEQINDDNIDCVVEEEMDTSDTLNEELMNSVKEYGHLLDAGHKVFVLQIFDRHAAKLANLKSDLPRNMPSASFDLAENIALVDAIPNWTVVDSMIVKVRNGENLDMMSRAFDEASSKIRQQDITAVFVTLNTLKAPVIVLGQSKWKVPVYDRSFILAQVFKSHATTKETKIHVALAELPYLKFSLMHRRSFKFNEHLPGLKATLPINDIERKLKASLVALKKQQSMVRSRRSNRQIPTIAVIGYTNSGKTTLIKALTGDADMVPKNQLFATLGVTAHSGLLPNRMMVVYMDTVGFISDLPLNMKSAFTSTLDDTINADVVIHVRDISHPDTEAQKVQVLRSVNKLLPPNKLDTMIEVCNKVDCVERSVSVDNILQEGVYPISAKTGEGMNELLQEVQTRLLNNIDIRQRRLKIPQNGQHLSWLHKESTVVSTEVMERDSENLVVQVYISDVNYKKFVAKFRTKK